MIADNIIVSSSTNPQVACVIVSFNNGIVPARLLLARNVIRSLTTGINIVGANSMQVIENIIQTNEKDDQGFVGIQFLSNAEGFPVKPVLRGNLIRNFKTGVQVAPSKHDIPNADFSHNRLENCTQGFDFKGSAGHKVQSPQIIGNIFDRVTTDIKGLENVDYLVLGGVGPGSVSIFGGKGTPEGVVPAPVGSMFMRFDGSPDNTLYVKQSGTGNTGWVAK